MDAHLPNEKTTDDLFADTENTWDYPEEEENSGERLTMQDIIFEIEDGILNKYNGKEEKVTIPNEVRMIGFCAFDGCETVKEIVIPKTVYRVE